MQEQLREQLAEWTARYRDVPATVPTVAGACADALGIRANVETLTGLKRRVETALAGGDLSALQGLGDIDQQIDREKTQLIQRALQTADRLYGERASYGEFSNRFDALPTARQGLQSRASADSIGALCTAARQATDGKSAYFAKNREKIKPRRDAYEQMLRFARSWRDAVEPGTLPCIDTSLSALPSSASDPARVDRAIGDASTCMAEYNQAHDEWVAQLDNRLASVASGLPAGDDVAAITQLRDELSGLQATSERLQPLYATAATDVASMKSRLSDLDLDVPASRWTAIDGLISDTEREAALLAVRDEAAQASFRPIVAWLTAKAPVVDRLASFAVLNRAFSSYAAGDLDGAVLTLRNDLRVTDDSPDAATKQAALAFFLHTKWAAERARAADDVAQLLLEDARTAGEQVYTLQANYKLPSVLAGRDAFESFMNDCRGLARGMTR